MSEVREEKKRFSLKAFMKERKALAKSGSKKAFWIWIAYQSIKGTLTLSFIWAPMIYLWFTK